MESKTYTSLSNVVEFDTMHGSTNLLPKKKTLVGKQKGRLSNTWLNSDCQEVTGRSLHCQVEHHVQTKFATPILHAIDNLKIDDISPTYT